MNDYRVNITLTSSCDGFTYIFLNITRNIYIYFKNAVIQLTVFNVGIHFCSILINDLNQIKTLNII
jgi:hypothetical protein